MKKVRAYKVDIAKLIILMTAVIVIMYMISSKTVFASEAVTGKINILKDLVLNIISAIGAVVTGWSFLEFGTAMRTQEGGAMSQALKGISGGLVMCVAPQVLALFI